MNINVQADKEVDVGADQQSILNKVNPHYGPTLFSEESAGRLRERYLEINACIFVSRHRNGKGWCLGVKSAWEPVWKMSRIEVLEPPVLSAATFILLCEWTRLLLSFCSEL